jgi:hypothetical protein
MIRYRKEAEPIQNGINIYPKDDVNSRGAVIKLGSLMLWCRYSLTTRKWHLRAEPHRVHDEHS